MSPHCFDHFTQIAPPPPSPPVDRIWETLMPQIRVNMRESEDDTTFETFFLTDNTRINPSIVLVRAEHPNTVGETICNVQLIAKCIYKALSILAWFDRYYPMYNNPSSKISPKKSHEELFGKKSHHT